MMTHRLVFTSLVAALAGFGFGSPAVAQPAQTGTFAGYHQSYNAGRYAPSPSPLRGDFGRASTAPPVGYACTWSGSRNLAQGDTAWQHASYNDAIAQWKTAASKDCAVAAYKLGVLYYGGNAHVAADRSLGAAWFRVAAESGTNNVPSYRQASEQAIANLTPPQRTQYVADYASLAPTLKSSRTR